MIWFLGAVIIFVASFLGFLVAYNLGFDHGCEVGFHRGRRGQ